MKSLSVSFTFISTAILLLCLSLTAIVVEAQEENLNMEAQPVTMEERQTNQAERQEFRAETQAEREANIIAREEEMMAQQAARVEQREEKRIALSEKAQQRILNLSANMANRMDAVAGRFDQIISRTESRSAKLAAQGIDTTEADAYLENARANLQIVSNTLATMDSGASNVINSENPRDAWQAAKSTFQFAREELKNTHVLLRSAVGSLKGSIRDAGLDTATSQAPEPVEIETTTTLDPEEPTL